MEDSVNMAQDFILFIYFLSSIFYSGIVRDWGHLDCILYFLFFMEGFVKPHVFL